MSIFMMFVDCTQPLRTVSCRTLDFKLQKSTQATWCKIAWRTIKMAGPNHGDLRICSTLQKCLKNKNKNKKPLSRQSSRFALLLLNIFHWWQIWPWDSSKLMVMNIWKHVWIIHIPYQLKESIASSYACPRVSDAQREKEVWIFSPGQGCNFYSGNKAM